MGSIKGIGESSAPEMPKSQSQGPKGSGSGPLKTYDFHKDPLYQAIAKSFGGDEEKAEGFWKVLDNCRLQMMMTQIKASAARAQQAAKEGRQG